MSKSKNRRDPIQDLQEWQEHKYNPGYWINRLPPFYPPKRSYRAAGLALFQAIMIFTAFLAFCWRYSESGFDETLLIPMGFSLLFSILALVGGIRLWPRPGDRENKQRPNSRNKRKSKRHG